jgi:hypothetical protein
LSKYDDALSLAASYPAIFGPTSSINSHDNLRNAWARFLRTNSRNSLFVTIHPHFGRQGGDRAVALATPGYERRDIENTWRLVSGWSRLVDGLHQGCRAPKFLPPQHRFQGFAVLEKAKTSPHVHIILSFRSRWEQILAYWFLLQAVDNVPAREWKDAKPSDVLNEEDAWNEIRTRGGWPSVAGFGPYRSCVTKIAPAATAKVLLVPTEDDLRRVAWYMTKELSNLTPAGLAGRRFADAYGDYFDCRELRSLHSPLGEINPATQWKHDPENPRSLILDLDHLDHWRCRDGKRLY